MKRVADTVLVVEDVMSERFRQDQKWGPSRQRPAPALVVLVEEVGEVANAMQDGTEEELRAELIQVAAVAVAMVEALDRGDVPRR
jgi:NTP pyrophosphatase (non-canonical NTP hydrolase)